MQMDLFNQTESTDPERPRCRMCTRLVRWMSSRNQWGWYCNGSNCDNRERLCQSCGESFVVGVDGAGTKYCSTKCKRAGYHPTSEPIVCAWCGEQRTRKWQGSIWPYICAECIEPVKHLAHRLKNHHVPHERARQLLEQPGCEICGRDLVAKVRDPDSGKMQSLLVVDHDHRCCPVERHSCGRCIRGLICRDCNSAAGWLRDDPNNAVALAAYLARVTEGPRFFDDHG